MGWILVSCTYIYILKKIKIKIRVVWVGRGLLKTIQFQPLAMGEDTSHQTRQKCFLVCACAAQVSLPLILNQLLLSTPNSTLTSTLSRVLSQKKKKSFLLFPSIYMLQTQHQWNLSGFVGRLSQRCKTSTHQVSSTCL